MTRPSTSIARTPGTLTSSQPEDASTPARAGASHGTDGEAAHGLSGRAPPKGSTRSRIANALITLARAVPHARVQHTSTNNADSGPGPFAARHAAAVASIQARHAAAHAEVQPREKLAVPDVAKFRAGLPKMSDAQIASVKGDILGALGNPKTRYGEAVHLAKIAGTMMTRLGGKEAGELAAGLARANKDISPLRRKGYATEMRGTLMWNAYANVHSSDPAHYAALDGRLGKRSERSFFSSIPLKLNGPMMTEMEADLETMPPSVQEKVLDNLR